MSKTISNKLDKYQALLNSNPNNNTYKYKVQKYSYLTQKGGTNAVNNPLQNTTPSGKTMPQLGSNDARTEELVSKIREMIDYTQQNTMRGGDRKKKSQYEKSNTRVKGFRVMKGGDVTWRDITIADRFVNYESTKPESVTDYNENRRNTIIEAIKSLKEKSTVSDSETDKLKKQIDDLQTQVSRQKEELKQVQEMGGVSATKIKELEDEIVKGTAILQQARDALDEMDIDLRKYSATDKELRDMIGKYDTDLNNILDAVKGEAGTKEAAATG